MVGLGVGDQSLIAETVLTLAKPLNTYVKSILWHKISHTGSGDYLLFHGINIFEFCRMSAKMERDEKFSES